MKYDTVEFDEESRKLCTITTPFGLFKSHREDLGVLLTSHKKSWKESSMILMIRKCTLVTQVTLSRFGKSHVIISDRPSSNASKTMVLRYLRPIKEKGSIPSCTHVDCSQTPITSQCSFICI